MIIEIEVKNIDYAQLTSVFLPQIKELSDNSIVQVISHVPSELAGNVIKHIPQSALDSLVELIVSKKKYEIMNSLEELASKKGFSLKLKNISVKSNYSTADSEK